MFVLESELGVRARVPSHVGGHWELLALDFARSWTECISELSVPDLKRGLSNLMA